MSVSLCVVGSEIILKNIFCPLLTEILPLTLNPPNRTGRTRRGVLDWTGGYIEQKNQKVEPVLRKLFSVKARSAKSELGQM